VVHARTSERPWDGVHFLFVYSSLDLDIIIIIILFHDKIYQEMAERF